MLLFIFCLNSLELVHCWKLRDFPLYEAETSIYKSFIAFCFINFFYFFLVSLPIYMYW